MGDCMSVDGQLLADGDMRSACKGGLRGAFRRCLQMELTWSKCTQCAIRERESVAHYGDLTVMGFHKTEGIRRVAERTIGMDFECYCDGLCIVLCA